MTKWFDISQFIFKKRERDNYNSEGKGRYEYWRENEKSWRRFSHSNEEEEWRIMKRGSLYLVTYVIWWIIGEDRSYIILYSSSSLLYCSLLYRRKWLVDDGGSREEEARGEEREERTHSIIPFTQYRSSCLTLPRNTSSIVCTYLIHCFEHVEQM